jgi:xanthine dehydrogenase YagT iron-sulfur-binding subunit
MATRYAFGTVAEAVALYSMQRAFVARDAFPCGLRSPGQLMSAVNQLGNSHATSEAWIRERTSGNLCRCAA